MKLIVISNPIALQNEASLINQLFDEGLAIFHLRKPEYSEKEITDLLKKINPEHHSKIALHQHHQLKDTFEIKRLHFTEIERENTNSNALKTCVSMGNVISTSVHSIDDFQIIENQFSYSLVGPVFDSISKKGYLAMKNTTDFSYQNTSSTKRIALGGICENNILQVKKMGFDGAAVLGIIWNDPKNSINKFVELNKINLENSHVK